MAEKPWRRWAKTYTHGWNLALKEPLVKANNSGVAFSGSSGKQGGGQAKVHTWRDDCCWKFNRNWCHKTASDCHYDHCCTYCGGWNHGYFNCNKRLKKNGQDRCEGGREERKERSDRSDRNDRGDARHK